MFDKLFRFTGLLVISLVGLSLINQATAKTFVAEDVTAPFILENQINYQTDVSPQNRVMPMTVVEDSVADTQDEEPFELVNLRD